MPATNMVHLYREASCRCKEVIKNYLEGRYHTKKQPLKKFKWRVNSHLMCPKNPFCLWNIFCGFQNRYFFRKTSNGSFGFRRERSLQDIDKDIETIWRELQELDKLPVGGNQTSNNNQKDKQSSHRYNQLFFHQNLDFI